MNTFYLILGLIIGIIGIALTVFSIIKKKTIAILIGFAIIIIGISLVILPYFLFSPELQITNPKNGEVITKDKYEEKIAQNGQTLIFSSITISGKNIPLNKYLHVFTCVSGGDECWVNGNPLPTDLISVDELPMNNITYGSKDDFNEDYILFLLITEEKINSGEKYRLDKLPDYLLKSNTISVRVDK